MKRKKRDVHSRSDVRAITTTERGRPESTKSFSPSEHWSFRRSFQFNYLEDTFHEKVLYPCARCVALIAAKDAPPGADGFRQDDEAQKLAISRSRLVEVLAKGKQATPGRWKAKL